MRLKFRTQFLFGGRAILTKNRYNYRVGKNFDMSSSYCEKNINQEKDKRKQNNTKAKTFHTNTETPTFFAVSNNQYF